MADMGVVPRGDLIRPDDEASMWSCRWSTDERADSSLIDGRGGNAGGNTASGAALPLSQIAAM